MIFIFASFKTKKILVEYGHQLTRKVKLL